MDTSAIVKLVVLEAESAPLADRLEQMRHSGDRLVASLLLHTEMHCAVGRRPEAIDSDTVEAALSAIDLVDIERSDLIDAAMLPGRLRSNDAIHLACARRLSVDVIVTYDEELAEAARSFGMAVLAPSC